MRFTQEQLTWKALCVVSEATEQARKTAVKPTLGLRFALAYLYAVSSDGDRRCYDGFWKEIQEPHNEVHHPNDSQQRRGTLAQGYMDCICRSVGVYPTFEVIHRLREMRLGK